MARLVASNGVVVTCADEQVDALVATGYKLEATKAPAKKTASSSKTSK